ncbi:EAL domain-containing protein, partial [Sphingomonadaceae bacterium]|nr:EAL domain-containing protein [Sphingomonadaceae bacterium]
QARSLESDLRRACAREDFVVNYQPVVDSASAEITGAEALLRWHCPLRGQVPPSEFIPVAEELGLISRIGGFVLDRACADAAKWPKPIDIAVNISPIQLADPQLVNTVKEALQNSSLAPERLELEITETALLGDEAAVLDALHKIRKLGVSISLDDFGTGYSSLSYLHRFPISRIKIDRSFVSQLPNDEGSVSIINAIAQLGTTMNMKITAEGVETQEQSDFVAARGCNNMQGYLFSKPVQNVDLEELLQEKYATLAA